MIPYEQALDESGKENALLLWRNVWWNQAQFGTAIACISLGVRGGMEESQRLIQAND